LTLALGGRGWSVSLPGRFTFAERAPFLGINWIGGWVGPRAGLNGVEKRKYCPCREFNPGRPARCPSLYGLNYPNSSPELNFDFEQAKKPIPYMKKTKKKKKK
jgi:hypothetical protein